jgi:hypothetical protein
MSNFPKPVFIPVGTYLAKSGPNRMRIWGLASTERLDLQNERVLQRGLDFGHFLKHGWFNDDHKKGTSDVLGYPTKAKYFAKGQMLPSGQKAAKSGWYVEGYIVDTKKGREVWDLARSLDGTGRSLGFSVEGKIKDRAPGLVKKAKVTNVAITAKPVNTDTFLVPLAKSLSPEDEEDGAEKAISAGHDVTPEGENPTGFALRLESLEAEDKDFERRQEMSDETSKAEDTAEGIDLAKGVQEDEEIVKAVNVTPFLRQLVEQVTGALSAVTVELQKAERLGLATGTLTKSVAEDMESLRQENDDLKKSLEDLTAKVDQIGSTPRPAKGATSEPQARRFADDIAKSESGNSALKGMTKPELLGKMEEGLMKALTEGNKVVADQLEKAIVALEGRNFVMHSALPLVGLGQ